MKPHSHAMTPAVLLQQMMASKEYVALRDDFIKGKWSVNFDEIQKEIDRQHSIGKVRIMQASRLTKHIIDEANIQNSSFRSRLVEIQTSFLRYQNNLDYRISVVKDSLNTTFATDLKKHFSTALARDSAIDTILKRPREHSTKLELSLVIIGNMILDLDKTAWTIDRLSKMYIVSVNGRDLG